MIINKRGQIIGDMGMQWCRDVRGFWSLDPRGYFIERLKRLGDDVNDDDDKSWTLFRKTKSSYEEKIPFVHLRITRGHIRHCMQVAEIYEIRRVL